MNTSLEFLPNMARISSDQVANTAPAPFSGAH
jgi:hypothetical protein